MRIYRIWVHIYFRMVRYIGDNGVMVRNVVMDNRYGQMVQYMRDIGRMVWQMVRVD